MGGALVKRESPDIKSQSDLFQHSDSCEELRMLADWIVLLYIGLLAQQWLGNGREL